MVFSLTENLITETSGYAQCSRVQRYETQESLELERSRLSSEIQRLKRSNRWLETQIKQLANKKVQLKRLVDQKRLKSGAS